jgi:histidinol-phosphate aminotransferase
VLLVDLAYAEFAAHDPTHAALELPNTVVLRTLSKAYGLAGLRVGYAVGHPDVIATVDKTMLPFSVNALAQVAALAALDHEAEIAARVGTILAERARVEIELAATGWTLPNHQGNFVWLGLGDATDEVSAHLERNGVVVRPFSGDGIRVTIGTAEENDRFLTTLAEVAAP